MNSWSNIEISTPDSEIIKINDLEKRLGELPESVKRIRELITRFEVCHFKYKQHLKKIKDSITELHPNVDPTKIGVNHIQHGEHVINTDTTGKSLIGQQYIWALKEWLNEDRESEAPDKYDKELGQLIRKWLGNKSPDKVHLVKLLLARLTWDWTSYEKLLHGGEFKDIEYQASRMDICHYAFPNNLDLLLQGIGQLKAVEGKEFEGCGLFNAEIQEYLEKEFVDMNNTLKSFQVNSRLSQNDLIRTWLMLCLAKTIKENIKILTPINGIGN
ncbi:hypothetical protein [Mangrovibacterium lignilyticum]|uniref:hypothetical protein n=1 Tax=Mangrovibacterium lignilyticum TaxID=2668052 RepID=UPI0013D0063D|nr:hypothetical protein [Mangrovibacterium lignilyticum]